MQLRQTIDAFGLHPLGCRDIVIVKIVDGAISCARKRHAPLRSTTLNPCVQRFRHPAARLLMRRGQKKQFHAAILQQLPGERLDQQSRAAVVIGQLGMDLGQANGFRVPADKDRRPPLAGQGGAAAGAPAPGRRSRSLQQPRFVLNLYASADHRFQAIPQQGRPLLVRTNNQHRIVSGDGSHHLRPIFAVDRQGDRLGTPAGGDQHQLVDAPVLPSVRSCSASQRCRAGHLPRFQRHAVRHRIAVGTFVEMQLVNISRERGLGYFETALDQPAAQLILAADRRACDEFPNCTCADPASFCSFFYAKVRARPQGRARCA